MSCGETGETGEASSGSSKISRKILPLAAAKVFPETSPQASNAKDENFGLDQRLQVGSNVSNPAFDSDAMIDHGITVLGECVDFDASRPQVGCLRGLHQVPLPFVPDRQKIRDRSGCFLTLEPSGWSCATMNQS